MRRIVLASIAMTTMATAATTTLAADLPRQVVPLQAPVYVSPYYNWSGLYLGINGGYGAAPHMEGGLVGGTVGYNWQFGPWVLGLEGDLDWSNVGGANCEFPRCNVENTWLSTVRGRVGYSVERLLPYVTGGAAFGDIKTTVPGFVGNDVTNAGWTVGAGIEFAPVRPWSVKIEYLYVDLGDANCGPSCGPVTPGLVNLRENIVRAGINYKF
jgi:outer membrane immunogenic protein